MKSGHHIPLDGKDIWEHLLCLLQTFLGQIIDKDFPCSQKFGNHNVHNTNGTETDEKNVIAGADPQQHLAVVNAGERLHERCLLVGNLRAQK